jgi:hypothetical protein
MKAAFLIVFLFINANAFCETGDPSNNTVSDTIRERVYPRDSVKKNNYDSYRIVLGMGGNWSFQNTEGPYAYGIIASYQYDFNVWSFRFIMNDGIGTGFPADYMVRDIGVLYGIGFHNSDWLLSASTGIEYVDKVWPANPSPNMLPLLDEANTTTHSFAFGLPYQVQILFAISRGFGIGIVVFGGC